jgi:hypothetical protein
VINMKNDLLRLLHSQDLGTVKPSAFLQVGSSVFPDGSTMADLAGFVQVVEAYRATHATAYGSPIPATSAAGAALVGSGDLLAVDGSSVALIMGVQVENTSATDPITADLQLNGVIMAEQVSVPPATTGRFVLQTPIYVDSNAALKVIASGNDATSTAAYVLTSL